MAVRKGASMEETAEKGINNSKGIKESKNVHLTRV